MAYLFFYVPMSFSIFYFTVFLVITTVNPSFTETSNIYNLSFRRSTTWYNNHPTIMDNGWKMKILLSVKNHSLGFYFGFYSAGLISSSSNDYLLSVVCVGQGNRSHNVVWSANGGSPVTENSILKLSNSGLQLLKPDGSLIWSAQRNVSSPTVLPVKGMKLSEEGNLVLFCDNGFPTWKSFDYPVDTLLVGQTLCSGQMLKNGMSFAGVTEPAYFSVYMKVKDGRRLIYGRLPLDRNAAHAPFGLMYEESKQGNKSSGCVVNGGSTRIRKSHPLEFIEFVKLDSDGRLRTYLYDSREQNGTSNNNIVDDMISRQCKRLRDIYNVTKVSETIYVDVNSTDAAVKSVTTIMECKRACRRNCCCSAVLFSYENDASSGNCYFASGINLVESNQMSQRKSLTFVKVLSVIRSSKPPQVLPPSPPNPLSPRGNTTKASPPTSRKKLAAIVSASTAGGIIMIILIIILSPMMLRKNKFAKDGADDLSKQLSGMLLRFSYEDLEFATENFKETLGRGGFGSVFKGVLKDGREIAVKRLDKMSQDMREFLAEVKTIGSIHHFNLVRLIGFSAENSCRLLVYEYMRNGSLDNWIFHRNQEHCLNWQTRKKIILDIAKGLAYLHEDCRHKIIHLDIKPHNILLDENFNAKVSDFGLSKLIERDESQVLIPMRGTPGYLAPELQQSIVTVKVDVYSFGIVVLEIVTNRRNVDSLRSESSFHLLKMLQKKAEEDRLIDIVEDLDEEMQTNREEVMRTIRIGAWCLQNDHTKRPSMSTVVKVLEGVVEVEPNISYKFSHAMASTSVENDHITVAPLASILSAPR